MTTREFTVDELDTLIAEACKPLHIVDGQPAIVGATSKPFVLYDENDGDTRIAVAAPDLAAFARRLLAERDEARDRLLRAWGEVSGWQHGEDCPAQYRDNRDDRDSDTCDEGGPVACDCGMDDLWALLDAREALPDTPPTLAEALKRNKALAAERDALRATVDRLRPVVEAVATWLEVEGTRDPGADPTLTVRAVEATRAYLALETR